MAAVDPAVARSSATNATRIRSLVADLNGPRYRDIADAAFELGPMVKDDSRAASIVRNAGAIPLLVSACDSVDARVQEAACQLLRFLCLYPAAREALQKAHGLPTLIDMCTHRVERVRLEAVLALANAVRDAAMAKAAGVLGAYQMVAELLKPGGAAVVAAAALMVVVSIHETLGNLHDFAVAGGWEWILKALAHPSERVRGAALAVLAVGVDHESVCLILDDDKARVLGLLEPLFANCEAPNQQRTAGSILKRLARRRGWTSELYTAGLAGVYAAFEARDPEVLVAAGTLVAALMKGDPGAVEVVSSMGYPPVDLLLRSPELRVASVAVVMCGMLARQEPTRAFIGTLGVSGALANLLIQVDEMRVLQAVLSVLEAAVDGAVRIEGDAAVVDALLWHLQVSDGTDGTRFPSRCVVLLSKISQGRPDLIEAMAKENVLHLLDGLPALGASADIDAEAAMEDLRTRLAEVEMTAERRARERWSKLRRSVHNATNLDNALFAFVKAGYSQNAAVDEEESFVPPSPGRGPVGLRKALEYVSPPLRMPLGIRDDSDMRSSSVDDLDEALFMLGTPPTDDDDDVGGPRTLTAVLRKDVSSEALRRVRGFESSIGSLDLSGGCEELSGSGSGSGSDGDHDDYPWRRKNGASPQAGSGLRRTASHAIMVDRPAAAGLAGGGASPVAAVTGDSDYISDSVIDRSMPVEQPRSLLTASLTRSLERLASLGSRDGRKLAADAASSAAKAAAASASAASKGGEGSEKPVWTRCSWGGTVKVVKVRPPATLEAVRLKAANKFRLADPSVVGGVFAPHPQTGALEAIADDNALNVVLRGAADGKATLFFDPA